MDKLPKLFLLVLTTVLVLSAWSVAPSAPRAANAAPAPTVTTDNATNITVDSATLNGTLDSLGSASSANVSFEWGLNSGNYTGETPIQSVNATGSFNANLSGLTPGIIYYFRAKAVGDGTSYGSERSFTTLGIPPTVTTDGASSITGTSATLSGTLSSLGSAPSANVSFEWGLNSGNYTGETPIQSVNATGSFNANLNRLSPGTIHYFRAKAVGDGTVYGTEISFVTLPPLLIGKWGAYGSGDGQFNYPWGAAVDSLGNVYVADYQNHRIQKFTSSGQFITKWGSYGGGDGQFRYPQGVAVDSAGNVYVVDTSNHRIQKFTSSGQFITGWGSYGSGDGQFYYPPGVAVDSSGNVYVVDTNNHRIEKFTSFGAFITKWGVYGGGDGQFNYPQGVAVDSSGNVYVVDYYNNRIQKFTSSGQFITKWGSYGSGDGQFNYPQGVAADSSGNVYVVDSSNNRIQVFGAPVMPLVTTGEATDITTDSAILKGQLQSPGISGTAIVSFQWGLGSGNYTSETSPQVMTAPGAFTANLTGLSQRTSYYFRTKAVGDGTSYGLEKRFTTREPSPPFLLKWGASGSGAGQFDGPTGVASDSLGNIYIADYNNHRIEKFTSSGDFVAGWGSPGSGDGQFSYPWGIAVDSSGNVYVADASNHRIQKFTSSGQFIAKWGSSGSGNGQFKAPAAVAVDSSGNVYVADTNNHRIQKFTSSGQFLTKWGSSGSGDGQFSNPRGVALDSLGNVYVADYSNHRIQKFTGSGQFLTRWGTYGSGDGQFNYPWGITMDSAGNVYVADSNNNRIQKFTGSGDFLTKWGSLGSGDGQLNGPQGVSVDSSGNVYVADFNNNRIQAFGVPLAIGVVTTNGATAVTLTSATLNGTLNNLGAAPSANVSFQWGLSSGNYTNETTPVSMNATGAFSANLSGLSAGTIYYFRAKAVGDGTNYGVERSFITLSVTPSAPKVITNDATNVTTTSAMLNGTLNNLGAAPSANVSFQWGLSSGNYTNETSTLSMNATGSSSANLSGLSPGTIYYFRAKAVGDGTGYGVEISFVTLPPPLLRKWGTYGSSNGQFYYPMGVAADSLGNVYVADTDNNRIQKFSASGQFITQWYVYYPYGIAVDSSDNVYVVEYYNHRIQKFTSSGQFITRWGSYGSGDGQFYYPQGVAADSSGNVYVVDTNNHRIQKFTSFGAFITQWGVYGGGDGQFNYPQGVAVDSAGNVYVSDTNNQRIEKFTSSGQFITKWGSYGSGDGQFNYQRGVAVDSSGNVYVADYYNHRIEKFTSSGQFITKWGSYGSGDSQFDDPWGITVDSSGNVYVADSDNNRIQVFGAPVTPLISTGEATNITVDSATLNGVLSNTGAASSANVSFQWGLNSGNYTNETVPQMMTAPGAFSANLTGLSQRTTYYFRAKVVGEGTSYGEESRFATKEPAPPFLLKWGSSGSGDGQFNGPAGVAIDLSGNVYVADYNNHRIEKFTSAGSFITKWGSPGSSDGQFNYPWGIAVDSSGKNVYVVDSGNHRIQRFTSSGQLLTKWGSSGSGYGQFNAPVGVAVDSSGNVYVADTNNHRIQRFTSSGQFLTSWGYQSYDGEETQLLNPRGVAVDSLGNVYVTDYSNHRILKFTGSGQFITGWGTYGSGDGQFNYPWGIAVDSSGNVYVVDSNNSRLQKFTGSGDFLTSWGSSGSGDGQFNWPQGVSVDSSGNVYVADFNNNRVQAFGVPVPLTVATDNATDITSTSALLNAALSLGTTVSANISFQWGLSSGNYTNENMPQTIVIPGIFSANLTGLSANTTYYFRAKAVGDGISYGMERNFTTFAADALIVTTDGAVSITVSSATLKGTLNNLGIAPSANVSFQWGLSPGNYTDETTPQAMTAPGTFSANLNGLSPGATYYFRVKAVSNRVAYGDDKSFTTASIIEISAPPRVGQGGSFIATVNITQVQNFDAASYYVSFNPSVLRLDSVTSGSIGGTSIPVDVWNEVNEGEPFAIVQNVPGLAGASGSGYLATLHFSVIGFLGQSSFISLSNVMLANTLAQSILVTWIDAFTEVTMTPGDANGDGSVNALDITKVERIVAHLDGATPGADANLDGNVNALDITKVERIIAGLD